MTDAFVEELRGLLCDLYAKYHVDGDGDDGLVFRLYRQHEEPRRTESHGGRLKPRSRPPGDVYALSLAIEIGHAVRYWTSVAHPTGATPPLDQACELLPDLAAAAECREDVRFDLRSVHRQALLTLGLARAPVPVRGVVCPYCRQTSIVYDPEASEGDVWCSNSGPHPASCHNDLRYPECRDEIGVLSCRRTERSQRHAYRWAHSELGMLGRAS